MITHTVDLDVVPNKSQKVIWLSQNDEDFTLVFHLFARTGTFAVEDGTTAMIEGTKPDKTPYSADAALDTSGETVTVTVNGSTEMTDTAGEGLFELTLKRSGKELHTANFIIMFEPAARAST